MTDLLPVAAGAATVALTVRYLIERFRTAATVVVTTLQGDSYRGRRCPTVRRVVALSDVEALSGTAPVRIGGRLEVPARNVALVQRLEAAASTAVVKRAGEPA